METVVIQLIMLFVLLMLSGFFSSAETAFMTVNTMKLRTLMSQGDKRAMIVLKIKEKPDKMLSAILIGNNIVNLSASALATTITMKLVGGAFISLTTGILTLLVLVFGEISPKSLAAKNSLALSLFYGRITYALMWLLTPVIAAVSFLVSIVLALCGLKKGDNKDIMTEEELRTIVEVGHEDGVIENEEKMIIENVFDFGGREAKDIMIPRIDLACIDVEAGFYELLALYKEERYTRYPVYEESSDNIIGVVNIKDLIGYEKKEDFSLKNYIREALFTYESKKISELLIEMKKSYHNIAIVLDEYGISVGMITMEDILEEIVGEIRDEYDKDEEKSIIKIGRYEYLIDASMKLDDINDRLGTNFESEEYESIGGLVLELLDRIPKVKEQVNYHGIVIRVEQMDKARIERVRIRYKNESNSI